MHRLHRIRGYNLCMRDLREYARQTNLRLLAGFVLLLLLVGGGLIWFFYGSGATILAVMCMLAGLALLGLIWLFLAFVQQIVNKDKER